MARIIYSVAGEGNGHAMRSKAVLDEISKDHEIVIAAADRANECLKKYYSNITKIGCLHIGYKNNSVSALKTAFINLKKIPTHFKTIKDMFLLILRFKPDLIINDFTVSASYLALLFRIPMITIDNMHVITKAKIDRPLGSFWDSLKSKFIVKLIVPRASKNLIVTFFHPPLKKGSGLRYVVPLIRKEVLKLKPSFDGPVLVYQTSNTNHELISILKQCNKKFIVYGFDKDEVDGNLIFKKFSDDDYLFDLKSCSGVIMNGGFSLMSEALFLGKPILSIPVKKQFEQMLNAYYLEHCGFGTCLLDSNKEDIEIFLNNLKPIRPPFTKKDVAKGFELIKDSISKLTV